MGSHHATGAVDAESFCLEHGMSKYEARTVAWLVLHHLALSTTAQKQDIGDPDVVSEFAALVGDQTHLDYLYVLTVADVRGTGWIDVAFKPCLKPSDDQLTAALAIAYHSDGNTHGPSPGEMGHTSHVQLFAVLPGPDGK